MKKLIAAAVMALLVLPATAQEVVNAVQAADALAASEAVTSAAAAAAKAASSSSSYWKRGVDVSLQATQNFVSQDTKWSSSWYNGGNSSVSGLLDLKGWFNYSRNKWSWENLVELKYGVNTNFSDDTQGRLFHLTDDKTAYSMKGGYAVGKGWNVAVNADFETTLFNNYLIDSNVRASGLFSPIRFNAGIGVDYKYHNDEHNLDLSVLIAPYSYKLIYVNDTTGYVKTTDDGDVWSNISDYVGIGVENQMMSYVLGSRVKVEYRQQFTDKIALESKLALYTNYKGVEVDWQITADFVLLKLLTARVSVNPRYDSTVDGGAQTAKLQLKELVSLGLAYRFEK